MDIFSCKVIILSPWTAIGYEKCWGISSFRLSYRRNKILIDLTEQPDEIKQECKQRIAEAKEQPVVTPEVTRMDFDMKYQIIHLHLLVLKIRLKDPARQQH